MLGISWDRIYLFPITHSVSFKEILTGVDQVSARSIIIQKFFTVGEQRSGEDSTLGLGDLERFLGGSVTCFIRRRPEGWGKPGDVVLPQHPVPLSLGFQLLHQEVRLCRELLGKLHLPPPPNSGGVKMNWCNYSLVFWCL